MQNIEKYSNLRKVKEDTVNVLPLSYIYRSSDMFCFELLSMVLALSGSGVGRAYLAQQHRLLKDLFSLLHTASPRVQRQVGLQSTLNI